MKKNKIYYYYLINLQKTVPFFLLCFTLLFGCTESLNNGPIKSNYHSDEKWVSDNPLHYNMFVNNSENCKTCHGEDLDGGQSGVSCTSCHHKWENTKEISHGNEFTSNNEACLTCHGEDLNGCLVDKSCFSCHHNEGSKNWKNNHRGTATITLNTCNGCHSESIDSCNDCHHSGWTGSHEEEYNASPNSCNDCHNNGNPINSCSDCHHPEWTGSHGDEYNASPNSCNDCHNNGNPINSCSDCHHQGGNNASCSECHTAIDWTNTGGESGGDKHGANIATGATHFLLSPYDGWIESSGFTLSCTDCHDVENAPNVMLIAGVVNGNPVAIGSIGDPSDLMNLCFACHANGTFPYHHEFSTSTAPYCEGPNGGNCAQLCHYEEAGFYDMSCSNCHFHGADDSWILTAPGGAPGADEYSGRRTF